MKIVEVDSYPVSIYVGFKNISDGSLKDIEFAHKICQQYCDNVGLCVNVTPTTFIYTRGSECGCIVGLINYPRFPQTNAQILTHSKNIGYLLKEEYKQSKISIVAPDKTIMIGDDEV